MHDDEFPEIIGSGTEHHVSVSERTGNAKTPKNIVTSHEEETEARKRAFEAAELSELEAKKALAAAISEHVVQIPGQTNSTNIQTISGDKETRNRQALPGEDGIKANLQNVGTDSFQDNMQSVPDGKNLTSNHQGVGTDAQSPNRQNLSGDSTTANQQSIGQDRQTDNKQTIGKDANASNVQALPSDSTSANRQNLGAEASANHRASISTENGTPNHQAIDAETMVNNRQTLAKEAALAPNQQSTPGTAPSLNRQAVDDGKIKSHFEPLPDTTLVRAKADLSQNSAQTQPLRQPGKATNATPSSPAKRPSAPKPLTAQSLQGLQLNHEKFNDEFHGRLAGIKHNVDTLNERLTDFEEKVHKEDDKLIKGNPDDFKVDLG
jgi:hypothetical protein